MRAGQMLCINNSSNSKGRISAVNKSEGLIDIEWFKDDNSPRYDKPIRYGLNHIKALLQIGTLSLDGGLSNEDPNLLFQQGKM